MNAPRLTGPADAKEVRKAVAVLMADGRWRTSQDVAARLDITRSKAGIALGMLATMGLLASEKRRKPGGDRITMYRSTVGKAK